MKKCILFFFIIVNLNVMGQSALQGEYQFHMQEMVAIFNFSTDGKFEFFYSYGVVDRSATGTFSVSDNTLHLLSNKPPGKDFTVKSQSNEGAGYRIQFEDENEYLLSNIRCSFFIGDESEDVYTTDKGIAETDLPHCDKIYVYHALFPDIVTVILNEGNKNNRFILTLNPSLAQVSFKGIEYRVNGNELIATMPNYIFPMEDVVFMKK